MNSYTCNFCDIEYDPARSTAFSKFEYCTREHELQDEDSSDDGEDE